MIPKGSLAWSNYGDVPMVFTTPDGDVISSPQFQLVPTVFGLGANQSGIFYATGQGVGAAANVYSSQLTLIASLGSGDFRGSVAIDTLGRGYSLSRLGGFAVKRINPDGTISGSTIMSTSPPALWTNLGVKPDGTGGLVAALVSRNVYSLDLSSGALALAVSEAINAVGSDHTIQYLDSGEVLIGWHNDTVSQPVSGGFVKRYNTGYSSVATYPTAAGVPNCLTKGLDNTTFWCSSVNGTSSVIVQEFRISDGAILHSFTKPGGNYISAFCVVRVDIGSFSPPPSALIPLIPKTPTTIVTSPPRSAGCNLGGVGWSPLYTGPSGVVPIGADPIYGELLTGSRIVRVWAEVNHDDTYA